MHDKKEYIIHKKFKTSTKSWISFEKNSEVKTFNQKTWLKSYKDINTEPRKIAKNDFEKDFRMMNNSVFGKAMETIKKYWALNL